MIWVNYSVQRFKYFIASTRQTSTQATVTRDCIYSKMNTLLSQDISTSHTLHCVTQRWPNNFYLIILGNWTFEFDVCKSVHHHTIPITQPTRCNSFTILLLDVYVWLNMFRASPRLSSGAYNCTRSLWFNRWRAVAGAFLVDQQRSSRFSPTVKPEAPSAVVCSWWWARRLQKHVEQHINVK
jgi:hypothetical protein